jgi:hypothetical protein
LASGFCREALRRLGFDAGWAVELDDDPVAVEGGSQSGGGKKDFRGTGSFRQEFGGAVAKGEDASREAVLGGGKGEKAFPDTDNFALGFEELEGVTQFAAFVGNDGESAADADGVQRLGPGLGQKAEDLFLKFHGVKPEGLKA